MERAFGTHIREATEIIRDWLKQRRDMTVSIEQTTVIRGEGFVMLRPAPPLPVGADLRSVDFRWDPPTSCEELRVALRKLVDAMDTAERLGCAPLLDHAPCWAYDGDRLWFEPLREARKLLQRT